MSISLLKIISESFDYVAELDKCCNTILTPKLHKKQVTRRDEMYFVTYCNIWLKYYITLCYVVADGKRGFNVLAKAIIIFYRVLCYLCSSTYCIMRLVTISFTVVFSCNAIIRKFVLKSSSISTINCFISLIVNHIFSVSCYTLYPSKYKYIFIGI